MQSFCSRWRAVSKPILLLALIAGTYIAIEDVVNLLKNLYAFTGCFIIDESNITLASLCGYAVFRNFSPDVIAATIAVAAGAILAMLSDTMIPEAFEEGHDFIGVLTVLGFLAAFMLTKISN